MAKNKELKDLSKNETEKKMKELKLELVKSKAGATKNPGKTKEIKRIIARLHTFQKIKLNVSKKEVLSKT